MPLFASIEHTEHALDRLSRGVAPFGMGFRTSKSRVLLQDWTLSAPPLKLNGEEQMIADRFRWLGNWVSKVGSA